MYKINGAMKWTEGIQHHVSELRASPKDTSGTEIYATTNESITGYLNYEITFGP
jgi:hypothetical protein